MKTKLITTMMAMLSTLALSAAPISIDTVYVGNAGNAPDTVEQWDGTSGYGAVDYDYRIGTTAVTNAQYAAFLNAIASESDAYGLYNANMATATGTDSGGILRTYDDATSKYIYTTVINGEDRGGWAVNYVNIYDAMRFCNWLTSGDTESGMYALNGVAIPDITTILRDATAWANGGVAIASEDEWYKAAFYNASNGTYYSYTNKQNDPSGLAGMANIWSTGIQHVIDADFGTEGPYNTYGQGGNVWEWTDSIVYISDDYYSILRGGSFPNNASALSSSARRNDIYPSDENYYTGFRVAVIPEPSTYAMIFGVLALGFAIYRRRK